MTRELIERLRTQFPACEYHKAVIDTQRLKREAADELERLTVERDALRKDAERYRWLRTAKTGKTLAVATVHSSWNMWLNTIELDAAIDAAIDAARENGNG